MSCGNPRPTVSVVVPVWGAERTLDRCVQSILGQRLRTGTLACVLVDDGSPDRCGAMCDEYARRDARVRVLHKEDGGVSSARNAGLRASEGEYVVFLDSDDALRPGALQAALDAQAADPGAFVLWRYTDDAGDPAAAGPEAAAAPQSALARLYLDCLIAMPWNKLYRGDLARRLWFNESFTLGEDLQFVLDYIALLGREQPGFHYATVQSPLTFYDCSRDDGTLSTRYHPEVCEIWPQHFAKLNAAAQAAGGPRRRPAAAVPRRAARVCRRRGRYPAPRPGGARAAPPQSRRGAALPLAARAAGPNARRALLQPLLPAAALALPAAFVPPGRSRPHRQPAFRQAGLGRVLPAGRTLEAGGVGKLPETSLL